MKVTDRRGERGGGISATRKTLNPKQWRLI
jgi:hypothetical protein